MRSLDCNCGHPPTFFVGEYRHYPTKNPTKVGFLVYKEIKYNRKMITKPLFKRTFGLLVLIGIADFVANTLYLYWTVWWADMIMHFSAGFCVAMAGILFWQYFLDKNIKFKKAVAVALLFTITIGLMWEIFETYFDIAMISDGYSYVTDTISDLILDVCGGILGSIYAYNVLNKK